MRQPAARFIQAWRLTCPRPHPSRTKSSCSRPSTPYSIKRDYAAAERFWSTGYIQHSAHIGPGREGLFDLIRSASAALRYENQLIVAEGDFVIAHGRFSGNGRPAAWIAADVVRIEDGKLAESWVFHYVSSKSEWTDTNTGALHLREEHRIRYHQRRSICEIGRAHV